MILFNLRSNWHAIVPVVTWEKIERKQKRILNRMEK